jgi:hypothetical protein
MEVQKIELDRDIARNRVEIGRGDLAVGPETVRRVLFTPVPPCPGTNGATVVFSFSNESVYPAVTPAINPSFAKKRPREVRSAPPTKPTVLVRL